MADNENQESLTQATAKLFQAGIALVLELWELAALELRLAGKSLISIVMLSIFLAILVFVLWIFLMAVCVAWLVSLQLTWTIAFLIIALGHMIAIFVILGLLARAKYRLTLPETRKQLGLSEED